MGHENSGSTDDAMFYNKLLQLDGGRTSLYFNLFDRKEEIQQSRTSVEYSDKQCDRQINNPLCSSFEECLKDNIDIEDVERDSDCSATEENLDLISSNDKLKCFSKFFHDSHNLNADEPIVDDQTKIEEEFVPNIEDDELYLSQEIDREFSLSQIANESKITVEPFYNISPRTMPESPHSVIEEEFKSNPWILLVATIFLTKTTAKVSRPIMKQFFADFPTPHDVINVDPCRIEAYFETLGMRKRGYIIWRMSYEFVSAKWRRASDLCGIGKYGEDAYRLFCLGHTDIEPTDRYLRLYLDWLKTQTDHLKNWSREDSENFIEDPTLQYYAISLR